MALPVPHRANDFPQNALALPAPPNGQPERHREDIPPPVRDVSGPQVPHHFDVAYQGVVDHHPQPLDPAYVFPNAGLAQGIPAQAQPNAPVNPERNPFGFGYAPQNIAPGLVQAAFPHPFVHHRVPTPNPAGAEDLRRLASRYVHHPDAQVGTVSMEVGAAGRFKVVIVLESNDIL